MQLEGIILQKTLEEWVNWKSHAPQQIGDEAHSFSRRRIGEILRLGFAVEGGQSCSNRDQVCMGRNPCICSFTNWLWDTEHLSHLPVSWLEREGELGMLAMMEWSLLAVSEDFFRMVPNGSEIQSP